MLNNKTVLITGAAQGIGKAAALLFAKQGANVVINDIDDKKLFETKTEVERLGVKAATLTADLLDPKTPQMLINETIKKFEKLDILVNNAGFTWDKMAHKMSDETFSTILEMHNVVPFRLIKAASPFMRECGKQEKAAGQKPQDRCVINISSTSGLHGNAGQINYATAKMGIIGLTKTIAKEWGPFGVRCNAVAFGSIDTRLTQNKTEGHCITVKGQTVELGVPMNMKELASMICPLQYIASPEEAAGGIIMLALPYASYITGHTLEVTGGMGI